MAHHESAKKRIRQTVKRNAINRTRTGRVRSAIKAVETAIAGGDKKTAEAALRAAQPEIHRGAARNVLHRNAAARKLSRLASRIKSL
ncbi:MAG: 30S ribosomal protein S20 [Dongiaceae bacterium]